MKELNKPMGVNHKPLNIIPGDHMHTACQIILLLVMYLRTNLTL